MQANKQADSVMDGHHALTGQSTAAQHASRCMPQTCTVLDNHPTADPNGFNDIYASITWEHDLAVRSLYCND